MTYSQSVRKTIEVKDPNIIFAKEVNEKSKRHQACKLLLKVGLHI